jgi:hypothetical protein
MSSFVINPYAFGAAEDPDAAAYLDLVEDEDGQALEAGVRKAVDDFVKGCKADGIWSDIKAACILAGARTLDGALVPLVGSAPSNTSLVSGDYDRENGLTGGSGKRLDTNRAANADPQNDFHMSVYVHTVPTSQAFAAHMATAANNTQIFRNNSATDLGWRCRSSTARNVSNSNVTGLIGANRSSSGSFTAYYNGATTTFNDADSATNQNLFVLGNTNNLWSNARLQFYSIGEATDLALLEGRLDTLMADLATAVV